MLAALLTRFDGGETVIGPGVGNDVAVVDLGDDQPYLALKSDPVTFATDRIGWYALNVNANDLATVGAEPRWFLATVLLPERDTDAQLAERILADVADAASALGVTVAGGHTEITSAVRRVVVAGSMIGTVERESLVRPSGLKPGDSLLLAGGAAVEATSVIAREFKERLLGAGLDAEEVRRAAGYLDDPGIGVLDISRVARNAGPIHAMHDPTEGGVVTALDELAAAASVSISVDTKTLREAVTPLTRRVCDAVGVDPLGAISSGAMLIGTPAPDAVAGALRDAGRSVWPVGRVAASSGPGTCLPDDGSSWPVFVVDEVARLF